MINNFHLLGAVVTTAAALLSYLFFSNFIEVDRQTFLSAVLTAFIIMEVSHFFRSWGAKGDSSQVLKGVSFSLGSKVAILLTAYLLLNRFTTVNIRYFLIILVAIYFFLFIFEVLYMMKMEKRNTKKT
ncbi:hypothetical protein E3V33_05770 [Candidatus Marinimicrobia bacterium MT.SAG.4]|nr:hypothetical protein E3V33_05770 [Candidatus Marinimicrobia bacterium MT.SAG.4]